MISCKTAEGPRFPTEFWLMRRPLHLLALMVPILTVSVFASTASAHSASPVSAAGRGSASASCPDHRRKTQSVTQQASTVPIEVVNHLKLRVAQGWSLTQAGRLILQGKDPRNATVSHGKTLP